MAITVRELLVYLGVEVDDSDAKRFNKVIDDTKRNMQDATRSASVFTTALGNVMAQGVNMAASAVRDLSRSLVENIAEYERLETALGTSVGNVEEARKEFERLVDFANRTPFDTQQVVDGFIKLKNRGLDPSEQALAAYGDTAAAMGKSLDQMIEAVADASTGEFERLKEFGIKASKKGNDITFTFRGVKTKIKNDSAAIEQYLIGLGQTNFGGGMEAQSKTLGGAISNLRGAMFLFAVQVGKGGLSDALKELIGELTGVTTSGEGLAKLIGRALGAGIRKLTEAIRWARANTDQLKQVLASVAKVIGFAGAALGAQRLLAMVTAMKALGAAMNSSFGILSLLAFAIYDLYNFMNGKDSFIGQALGEGTAEAESLKQSINELIKALGIVGAVFKEAFGGISIFEIIAKGLTFFVLGIAVIIAAIVKLGQIIGEAGAMLYIMFSETIPEAVGAFVDSISSFFGSIADFFKKLWGNIERGMSRAFKKMGQAFYKVGRAFVRVWERAKSGVSSIFSAIASAFQTGFIDPITSAFKAIGDFIDTYIIQPIKGFFGKVITAVDEVKKRYDQVFGTAKDINNLFTGGGTGKLNPLGKRVEAIMASKRGATSTRGQNTAAGRINSVVNNRVGNVTVNVNNPGASATQVGQEVRRQVPAALNDNSIRQAQRQLGGG